MASRLSLRFQEIGVAFAMARLGMSFDDVHTALDLEEGMQHLARTLRRNGRRAPR